MATVRHDRPRDRPLVLAPCRQAGQRPAGADTSGRTWIARAPFRRAFGAEPALAGTRHSGPEVRAARLSRTSQTDRPVHRGLAERAQRATSLTCVSRISVEAEVGTVGSPSRSRNNYQMTT